MRIESDQKEVDTLAAELPEVFELKVLPGDWDEEWIFVPVEEPEEQRRGRESDVDPLLDTSQQLLDGSNRTSHLDRLPAEMSGGFPGSLRREPPTSLYPPPDVYAFYLPFHYFYPTWWGIYLLHEGVLELAQILETLSGARKLKRSEYAEAARIFLFGHEQFHHEVESFGTRLEVTHRSPLYRLGFEAEYRHTYGKDECIEEALANAHGVRRVLSAFKHPQLHEILEETFYRYIEGCGPGYCRGFEFVADPKYIIGRNALAELYHGSSLPSTKKAGGDLWRSFPRAFHPFRTRNGRVNFLIHKDSVIAKRAQLLGRFFSFKDVSRRVEKWGCTPLPMKGGSHVQFRAPRGGKVTIPRHPGDLKPGTLKSIIRQIGLDMSNEQFMHAEPAKARSTGTPA